MPTRRRVSGLTLELRPLESIAAMSSNSWLVPMNMEGLTKANIKLKEG